LSSGWKQVTVEAEGWAPLVDADLLSAKRRALIDAQKKAVEKAVGVTVKADTRVDNAIALRQSISANMGGTIRRYDILSESSEDGFLKVRIRAAVLYRIVAEHHPMRPTRFFVRITGEKLASALRAELTLWDYPLVESSEEADVVVTGVMETFGVADSRLGGLYSCKAKVTLDVADVPNGEVSHQAYEASAIDLDDRSAYEQALQKAGRMAGLDIATRFSAKTKPDAPPRPVESAQAW
jgi:hypothetical protein